jgi:hypothetical protein
MQLSSPVEPFGEVNIYPLKNGNVRIVATVLLEPDIEGAATGLALDASASMKKMYGAASIASSLFKNLHQENHVEPVAHAMAEYLAKFAADGKVHLLYWALQADGSGIQLIGVTDATAASSIKITGPKDQQWGRGTKLLPPLRYFCEEAFPRSKWAVCVFITDGIIEDLAEVKKYSLQIAQQMSQGRRNPIKFVLLGVGNEVDENQMSELDDMFEESNLKMPNGQSIDLWDHKLAATMRQLSEIFAEVVSEDMIVAPWGKILLENGTVVRNYSDGLPAKLCFELPRSAKSFRLQLPDSEVVQSLLES